MNYVRIYRGPIASTARSGRRKAECEAVLRLVERAFGPDAVLGHDSDGRPYILALPDVHVSIAHCMDECVLAVSDSPVGVDVETARPQLVSIAPKFLTPLELASGMSHDIVGLMRYWTAKEAVFKCAGVKGLVISDIEVGHESEGHSVASCISRVQENGLTGGNSQEGIEKFLVVFPLVTSEKVIAVAAKEVGNAPIDILFF